jgi:hypothetical protein
MMWFRDIVLALLGLVEFLLRLVMVIILVVTMLGLIPLMEWLDEGINPVEPMLWKHIGQPSERAEAKRKAELTAQRNADQAFITTLAALPPEDRAWVRRNMEKG